MICMFFFVIVFVILLQIVGGDCSFQDVELVCDLVECGQIMLLVQVLMCFVEQYFGQVVEVELEYSDGILVYEVDLIIFDGCMIEVDMDVLIGKIVDIDEDDDN